jgi:hypothetical protein
MKGCIFDLWIVVWSGRLEYLVFELFGMTKTWDRRGDFILVVNEPTGFFGTIGGVFK